MDSIKCSVVIPCYNQAQYLSDAIQSILNQTYNGYEIIVVNDGSSDNTSEVARQFPVMLVEQENRGLSGARNSGIKAARGEYIVCLDADDKLDPTFLEKTLNKGEIVAVGQEEFGDSHNKFMPWQVAHEDFLSYNRINCSSMFLKTIWEQIGGYDEQMRIGYEDWDFWLRATQKGYRVIIVSEYLFFYRKHGFSMVSGAIKKHEQLKKYILDKYYGLL